MVLSENYDNQLLKKYQDLCTNLNLDVKTTNQAWDTFQTILTNYTLEGDPLHWLGCSIFVACRRTKTLTVGRTVVEGNCVSLTSLLRYCNLSLTQFFNKITKWADMANMPDEFKQKIQRLEGNFAVSYNIFKKFAPIFNEIFKNPTDTEQTKHRNRKAKTTPCTPSKVFEFCWILFTTVKGEDPTYSEDLVISYHLLLACCDLAFSNAILEDRRDLLNPNFEGLPSDWGSHKYVPPEEAPSIIDIICNKFTGISTQAKYDKEYSWKKHIKDLFDRDILQGDPETFTGLFEHQNFDTNLRNITKAYEVLLLNKGDFDERIFLADYRRRLLLKEQAIMNSCLADGEANVSDSPFKSNSDSNSLTSTPLKTYQANKSQGEMTPLTTAIQSVSKLQAMLKGRPPVPSEVLIQIFRSCANDPLEKIKNVIERVSEKYRKENNSLPNSQSDYASQRLKIAIALFYKFIEGIFQRERNLHKDISHLAELDIFYECTLACSIEIISYSYNCQKKFPWILQALGIQPFDFVRVIELIVRSQDQMPRDAVKHLNMVEQKIIESLIWKSDSPIWEAIKKSGDDFPKFEETALPGNLVYTEQKFSVLSSGLNRFPMSPNLMQSPDSSAFDRFLTPIQGSQVKKQLFGASSTTKPGQSVLQNSKTVSTGNESSGAENGASNTSATSSKPKKSGSLSIILRKFYNLAGSRLQHLCELLGFTDIEFHRMIWTVFEHSIREHTYLMKERHLDQLLMCAVYVICKVTGKVEKGFTEIMRCYREQPQADSHIYRNVLISREVASDGTVHQERGDLILFYNSVYVKAMRSFALQFSTSNQKDIMLSPLPYLSNNKLATSRCQVTNNIYIKPYEGTDEDTGFGNSLEYHFSRSPSRDLEKINSAISKGVIGKRLLNDENGDLPNKKFATRKVQSLMEERRSHAKE